RTTNRRGRQARDRRETGERRAGKGRGKGGRRAPEAAARTTEEGARSSDRTPSSVIRPWVMREPWVTREPWVVRTPGAASAPQRRVPCPPARCGERVLHGVVGGLAGVVVPQHGRRALTGEGPGHPRVAIQHAPQGQR